MSIGRVDIDDRYNAMRSAHYPPQADGAFFHASRSGALAGAAAASVVWAFRYGGTLRAVVELLRIRALPTTPFTAAQEWGFDAVVGRTYSASHTGGTQYVPGDAGGWKKQTADSASTATEIRMATTAALGGGTVTPDASPFVSDMAWELVAGATVPRSRILAEFWGEQAQATPIILAQNEGILVRPLVTLGAGGVVRLAVEIGWRELDSGVLIPTTR